MINDNNGNSLRKIIPLGIYVHIPFCQKKCGYCDFYSLPLQSPAQLQLYTEAIQEEAKKRAEYFRQHIITSIYLGGGTPSLLSLEQLQNIMQVFIQNYNLSDDVEISLEMNPATMREGFIKGILATGINRISLGVQSFSPAELKVLGRVHGYYEIINSIEALHIAGCQNFNLDLIYGIPGQSLESWQRSLELAISYEPKHISTYLLQLGERTAMAQAVKNAQIELPGEEIENTMFYMALDNLSSAGFRHYEISNFCRTGYESCHNLNYWSGGDYIGIGAGAVSCIERLRYRNRPSLKNYLISIEKGQEAPVEILEQMSAEEKMREEIILSLRLCNGIDLTQFLAKHKLDFRKRFAAEIKDAEDNGLLKLENNWLALTRKGYFLSNQVFCLFI